MVIKKNTHSSYIFFIEYEWQAFQFKNIKHEGIENIRYRSYFNAKHICRDTKINLFKEFNF